MAQSELERDIRTQVHTWQASIDLITEGAQRFRTSAGRDVLDTVLVTGCGSSYYLAQAVAGVAWAAGVRAVAVPSSDVLLERVDPNRVGMAIGLSRSGETTEVVEAVGQLRRRGVYTLGISTNTGSALLAAADQAIALPAGRENTVVMTKSFSTMFLAATALLEWAVSEGDSVVQAIARMQPLPDRAFDAAAAAVAGGYRHFVFLGSGPFYGVAAEAMLKVKEMAYVWSEAYHPLELRHGLESTVDADTYIVLLASTDPRTLAMETPVLTEMESLGAKTYVIRPPAEVAAVAPVFQDAAAALVAAPYLQYMALAQCLATGVDPTVPRHGTPVVKLGLGGPDAV